VWTLLRRRRSGVAVGGWQPGDIDTGVGVWSGGDAVHVLEVAGTGAGAADVGDGLALLAWGWWEESGSGSVRVTSGEAGGEGRDGLVANVTDTLEVVATVEVVVDVVAVEESGSELSAGGNEGG